MKMKTGKPELLAPAGGIKALRAAVQSGADAVYLGADKFSARGGADNFTLDTLGEWIDYCHLRKTKVHLAANTLIKENEADEFLRYVCEAYSMGIDAVIIQDIGMAARLRRLCPDLSLHASTQMTVTTAEGVRYLEEMGFDRVVLARELTLHEIEQIRRKTSVELEVFVHGALCFCYSGQCLMSSVIGQRSGNRGLCAQPCRLPYSAENSQKSGYLLSPKDLCLAKRIGTLSDIGVDSFKIEGRLKSAEYVATVTGVYRKCIDEGRFTQEDNAALLGAFNRSGFTEGWYGGAKDMMSGKSPSNVANNTAGADYVKYTKENADFRKTGVSIFAELKKGSALSLTMLSDDGASVSVCGEVAAQEAVNAPMSQERLSSQLKKLGASAFCAENVEIVMDGDITIPVSEINAVRRRAAQMLEAEIAGSYKRKMPEQEQRKVSVRERKEPYITAACANIQQAKTAAECGADKIALPYKLAAEFSKKFDGEVISVMPPTGAGETAATQSVMVMNNAQIEKNTGKSIYGGFRLNLYNSDSCNVYSSMAAVTLSCELNLKEIRHVCTDVPCEVMAYGRLPLMLMRNCPAKVHKICSGGGGVSLRDRRGEKFMIRCGEGCVSELLNSKVIYMADKLADIKNAGVDGIQLWFYEETPAEVGKILEEYKKGLSGEAVTAKKEFTRGHFYRGVV